MSPIIIQDNVSVPAGTTVENVISLNTAANRYIRSPMDAIGKMFLGVSALALPGLRLELIVDGKCIMDNSDARQVISTAQLLQPDDEVVEQFFIRKGAQLVLRATNQNAGALSVVYRFELTEATAQPAAARYTQRNVSILANTTVQVLSQLRFERPIVDSLLAVFASAGATGLLLEVFVDGNSVAPALPIAATNRMPLNPYDKLLENIEVPQDHLIELRVQNTTGGSLALFFRTHLQEIEVRQ